MSLLALALLAAQGQECRTVSVDNNGKMRQAILCRGADGQWRERENATQPEPLPANFQGVIVYEGELDGVARLRPSNPNRQGQELVYGGLVRYRTEYDGNLVSVRGDPIKAEYLAAVTLTGTRSGSTCTLFEPNGTRWLLRCDRTGLTGTVSGTRPDNRGEWRWQHSLETLAVSVKSNADLAADQAQRVAEKQKQEALAKEERRKAAIRELPELWAQFQAANNEFEKKNSVFERDMKPNKNKSTTCANFGPVLEQHNISKKIFERIENYRTEFPELVNKTEYQWSLLLKLVKTRAEYINVSASVCNGY